VQRALTRVGVNRDELADHAVSSQSTKRISYIVCLLGLRVCIMGGGAKLTKHCRIGVNAQQTAVEQHEIGVGRRHHNLTGTMQLLHTQLTTLQHNGIVNHNKKYVCFVSRLRTIARSGASSSPVVTCVNSAKFFTKPHDSPSGVSLGLFNSIQLQRSIHVYQTHKQQQQQQASKDTYHNMPHCDGCRARGPEILRVFSNCEVTRVIMPSVPMNESRDSTAVTPARSCGWVSFMMLLIVNDWLPF
jgi:hypothetical protein